MEGRGRERGSGNDDEKQKAFGEGTRKKILRSGELEEWLEAKKGKRRGAEQ